jgi:hypothetical protein
MCHRVQERAAHAQSSCARWDARHGRLVGEAHGARAEARGDEPNEARPAPELEHALACERRGAAVDEVGAEDLRAPLSPRSPI